MCQFTWLHGSLIPWGRKDPFPLHGSVFGKAKTETGSHLIRWLRGSMTLWGLPWLKGPVRATMTCGPLKVPKQGSESEEHSCSTYSSSVSGGGRSSRSSSCGTSSWMRHMSSEVVATAVCWQIPRPVEWCSKLCCLFLPRNLSRPYTKTFCLPWHMYGEGMQVHHGHMLLQNKQYRSSLHILTTNLTDTFQTDFLPVPD